MRTRMTMIVTIKMMDDDDDPYVPLHTRAASIDLDELRYWESDDGSKENNNKFITIM